MSYITIRDYGEDRFIEKKSEFIGYAKRVENEEEAKAFIKKEERKVMLVTTTFKIEKKNVDFSRILYIKTYEAFFYFKKFAGNGE